MSVQPSATRRTLKETRRHSLLVLASQHCTWLTAVTLTVVAERTDLARDVAPRTIEQSPVLRDEACAHQCPEIRSVFWTTRSDLAIRHNGASLDPCDRQEGSVLRTGPSTYFGVGVVPPSETQDQNLATFRVVHPRAKKSDRQWRTSPL